MTGPKQGGTSNRCLSVRENCSDADDHVRRMAETFLPVALLKVKTAKDTKSAKNLFFESTRLGLPFAYRKRFLSLRNASVPYFSASLAILAVCLFSLSYLGGCERLKPMRSSAL